MREIISSEIAVEIFLQGVALLVFVWSEGSQREALGCSFGTKFSVVGRSVMLVVSIFWEVFANCS
jgi:hypothetical protein